MPLPASGLPPSKQAQGPGSPAIVVPLAASPAPAKAPRLSSQASRQSKLSLSLGAGKRLSNHLDAESPASSRPDSSRQAQPPLRALLDANGEKEDGAGFFGSIRFSSAPFPSKFVRLASKHDFTDPEESGLYARHVVDLALSTWKLPAPCAMISIPDAGSSTSKLSVNSRLDLVVRRGIAEAAYRTGAWIFTGGNAGDPAAHVAGRAMLHLANEHGDSNRLPVIGVLPWRACNSNQTLAKLPNGFSCTYVSGKKIADPATLSELAKHGMEVVELDTHHSHFLMVDGPVENAALLRGTVEKYISDNDVSKDHIQTPKVVLCVGGGASAFKHIRDQLDAEDESTGVAVPCLVLVDSGGAAEDIYNFFEHDVYPTADPTSGRDKAYVAQAKEHLAEIKRLGLLTGQNSRSQLAFFRLSDDLDAKDDLALEIQCVASSLIP